MARKRLTAATLDDERMERVGGQAVDLVSRMLGKGATDREIVAAGRYLNKAAGPKGIAALHRLASKVTADSGEDIAGSLDDESDQDPRKTQDYVAEHEVTPDHAVLDVVLHERNPTQNPTARRKKMAKPVRRAAEEEDEDEPDLEEPDDIEVDEDDHVDDDEGDDEEDEVDDDEGDDEEDEVDDDEGDDEEDEVDDDDLEDEAADDVTGDGEMMTAGDDDDADAIDEEDVDEEVTDADDMDEDPEEGDAELGDDDGEFSMDDMEELENMGVDGVLTSSATGHSSDTSRARRSRDGTVVKGRQAHRLAAEDSQRDAERAYRESLDIERSNSERFGDGLGQPRRKKSRKASRQQPRGPKTKLRSAGKKPAGFRPARTRVASAEVSDNEFDNVWNEPDVSAEFTD